MYSLFLPIFLLVINFSICETNELPSPSVKIDPNTVLVLWGTRHGNRHPERFLDDNPRTWGFEGTTELTEFGKRQALGLGRELRSFVGDWIPSNFNRSQVKYYTSSANRCQMTLQVALAGFHVPQEWGDWDEQDRFRWWSPVPYNIDDVMLRMYSIKKCKKNKEAWAAIDSDSLSSLAQMKSGNVVLLNYIREELGWNMTSLSEAADLADNVIEMNLYNATFPEWIQNPTLAGYDMERLKKEILDLAEVHQIACANYAPCGNLMGGVWLENILNNIEKANKGEAEKMIGYASHTEITLSVMKLMGIVKNELTTSAGFLLEFRRDPTAGVRLLNHDPDPIDKHVIYKATLVADLQRRMDPDGFIPLDDFIDFVKPRAICDWRSACGIDDSCGTIRPQRSSSSKSIISLILLLLFIMFQ